MKSAFRSSQKIVAGVNKTKKVFTCCCGHQHKPDCLWYQKRKEKGINWAHAEHTFNCNYRKCPKRDQLIHNPQKCNEKNIFWAVYVNRVSPNDNPDCCCGDASVRHNET